MNARSMILALYADFCDTQFYHSFTECTATQTPFMSDDFETMLQKLNEIQWDTLTSEDHLQGMILHWVISVTESWGLSSTLCMPNSALCFGG